MRTSGRLQASTVRVADLTEADTGAMWALFAQFYDDVSEGLFQRDLSSKNHVILVRDSGDGTIQGFSTLQILRESIDGKKVVAIFSGDTIISPRYWGQSALQRAFFRYIVTTKIKNPRSFVYWFLISKGYKTYLLLSRNFVEYWPRHDQATPPWQSGVLDALARKKFGEAWRPEQGILQFASSMGRLREAVAPIDEKLMERPDIRFFAEKNPRHQLGDELCCLGRVDARLAYAYPVKLARKLLRGKRRARVLSDGHPERRCSP